MARWPTKTELAGMTATAGFLAQLFGYTIPTVNLKDANRAGHYEARDALKACNDRYISHLETEH